MMMIRRLCLLFGLGLFLSTASADDRSVQVAVYHDTGTGRSLDDLMRTLREIDGVYITRVTAEEIRNGVLDDFDVIIHPGGSGSRQGNTLGEDGRNIVRDFVRSGQGYIGICAGAYLASADYPWSLHVLDAKVLDRKHWNRGTGTVQIGLTDQGKRMLEREEDSVSIFYGQGPLLAPAGDPDIQDFESLATYESEIAKKGAPTGVMIGTTAIARGDFGKGRVVCFSPHPEKTDGLGGFIGRAIREVVSKGEEDESQFPSRFVRAAKSTPDISQKGMPNGDYCAPCATANLLSQFAARSLLDLSAAPSGRTLAETLGDDAHMETKSKRGTDRYRLVNGLDRLLREHTDQRLSAHYLGVRRYDETRLDDAVRRRVTRTCGVPKLRHIQEGLSAGDGVIILFGSYKPNPERGGRLERVGGHYVCAVGYGEDASGRPDPSAVLLHDSNDGHDGAKEVFVRPVTERTELFSDGVRLVASRSLAQLENAPIRKDGRVAFLETVFTFRAE